MSGRKNVLPPFQTINAGDMSQASITSSVTSIQYLDNICIELIWSGTSPIGTIAIQGSLNHAQDAQGNVTVAGTWVPMVIGGSPTQAVSGNSGSMLFDLSQLSFPYIRIVYTKTSGIGTLDGYIGGKQI